MEISFFFWQKIFVFRGNCSSSNITLTYLLPLSLHELLLLDLPLEFAGAGGVPGPHLPHGLPHLIGIGGLGDLTLEAVPVPTVVPVPVVVVVVSASDRTHLVVVFIGTLHGELGPEDHLPGRLAPPELREVRHFRALLCLREKLQGF